jgi:4-hydroxy-2-oxoheptanedioate aldolase
MYPNPLKQKLNNGELILGSLLLIPSPFIAGMIIQTQPDFLWIDTEHLPFGTEALEAIPVLARQKGVAPLIRVAWNDPALIKKAYDVGAVAVMVPQVNTPEEAARAVRYAHYPPEGERGISPTWPLISGDDWNQVIKTANQETILILQIESLQAYQNLDDIAKVPGIDVLFVGPLDLSGSIGKITETQSKEVQEMMREIPRRLEGTGVVAGTTLSDVAEIQEKIRWGYRFINVGDAVGYGVQVLQQHLTTLRARPTGD